MYVQMVIFIFIKKLRYPNLGVTGSNPLGRAKQTNLCVGKLTRLFNAGNYRHRAGLQQ